LNTQNATTREIDFGDFAHFTLAYTYQPAAIPEPATWAMMLFGFGAVGVSLRKRPLTARTRVRPS